MNSSLLDEVLRAGIQAPSADNLQPWRFHLLCGQDKDSYAQNKTSRIALHLVPESAEGFAAAGFFTLYISAGAVIENIRVAGASRGVKVDVKYFPVSGDSFFVAELLFSEIPPQKHRHEEVIFTRVTNRKFYAASRAVDPKVYSDLSHTATELGFRLTRLKRGEERYKKLEQILAAADQLRYENERLHSEFFKTIRFSSAAADDGLPLASFEAGPGTGILFNLIRSWPRLKAANFFGFSRMMGFYTELQMKSSDAAVLLTSASTLGSDLVRGGEAMEKIWHELTLQGLAAQPMEALPIFILNLQQGRMAGFSQSQHDLISDLKKQFFEIFNLQDSITPLMLWRVGYAPAVSARTRRRPVASFMKD